MVNARWAIGRVGQPRGLKGDVRARLLRNEPLYLEPGRILLDAEGGDARIIRVREQQGPSVVLHIEGVDTREAAEALQGRSLYVESAWFTDRLPPEALIGARVIHAEGGALLGEVSDFYDNGAQVLLAVLIGGVERLVPYVDPFIVGVKKGTPPTLELRPIPGLLEDEA